MKLEDFRFEVARLPGAMPVWHRRVNADGWREALRPGARKGGRLIALWGADNSDLREGYAVHAALTVHSDCWW